MDLYNWLIIYCHISHYLTKRIIFYVHIKYICLNSHMQSTLSLRKDQHFVLCPRTLTGKRWLMTWKNLKGESILPFTSTEEMLKTTCIQKIINFQPFHQLPNGSLKIHFSGSRSIPEQCEDWHLQACQF